MKNKSLPLSLVTLVILLGAFLISATGTFPESFFNDPDSDSDTEKLILSDRLVKLRANQHTGVVDMEDVIKARQQAIENASKSTMQDFNWNFMGPDNVGGYTRAVLFDNKDEDTKTIIVGAVSGGLYKTTNTGLTWTKINGIENNLNVTAIAQAADGTIYVSTGTIFIGSGIYKSTDGENFSLLPSTDPFTGGTIAFAHTTDLEVNQNDGTIYASTWAGVWYSKDAGTSWEMAKTQDDIPLDGISMSVAIGSNGITATEIEGICYISETGNPGQFAMHSGDTFNLPAEDADYIELAIAPSNPDILYATVIYDDGEFYELNGIYRSDNKGVNWRLIAPGGSQLLWMAFSPLYNVLEVFPNDPDKILVGGIDMWEGTKIDENGYFQWVQKSSGFIPPIPEPPVNFHSYVQSGHHTYVFRPGKDDEIFVGCNGGIFKGTMLSEYYLFGSLNNTYTTSQAEKVGIGGKQKVVLGGFEQNGVQLFDGTGNPAQALNGNQILNILPWGGTNGGEVFLSQIDPLVAIYSVSGGQFVRDEDLGENPSAFFLGGGMEFPDFYIAPALFWENVSNENSRDTVEVIVNANISAGTELWIFHPANRNYPFLHTTELAYNEGDTMHAWNPVSTKFFIGSEDVVWMSTGVIDFTNTPVWFQITNDDDGGFEGLVSAMAMSADANFVFVGTEEGSVYRLANISLAYDYDRADIRSPYCIISTAEIITQEENDQYVTSIAVDPQDPNNVVVTLGNYGNDSYILRSTNALSAEPTFTSKQGNLPQMPLYSSIIEMKNSNMCIVGTEMGIYETSDLSAASPTWDPSYGITGQVPVFDLKQQITPQEEVSIWFWDGVDSTLNVYPGTKNYGSIYAATYGRGLYFSNKYLTPVGINSQEMPDDISSINIFPNPVSNLATIEYTLEEKNDIIVSVFNINGKLVVSEQITQDQGTHQYKMDCSSLPRGTYIVSIHTGRSVQTSKFIVAY